MSNLIIGKMLFRRMNKNTDADVDYTQPNNYNYNSTIKDSKDDTNKLDKIIKHKHVNHVPYQQISYAKYKEHQQYDHEQPKIKMIGKNDVFLTVGVDHEHKTKHKQKKTIYNPNSRYSYNEIDKIEYVDIMYKPIELKENRFRQSELINDLDNNTVFELFPKYGLFTCMINNKIFNPENHFVFMYDNKYYECLQYNKDTHSSFFTIISGSYLLDEIKINHIVEKTVDTIVVNRIDYKNNSKLMEDMLSFIENNLSYFIKHIKTIIFETVIPELDDLFIKMGYTNVNHDGGTLFWHD